MRILRDVRQLLRVAEQDDVARRRADGHCIRKRRLPCFVDEEVVERLIHPFAREQPGSSGHELRIGMLAVLVRVDTGDECTLERRLVAGRPLLMPAKATPSLAATRSTSSSRL